MEDEARRRGQRARGAVGAPGPAGQTAEHPVKTVDSGLLARLAGLRAPVDRGLYLKAGLGLAALKFGAEAALVFALTGQLFSPLAYLLPLASLRAGPLDALPDLVLVAMALWTLPFAWVGATMSVRRARDAGLHPAVGLGFLLPFLNYVFIGVLAALPTRRTAPAPRALQGPERGVAAALTGVAAGSALAIPLTAFSTLALGGYGAGLFLGGPFLMSAIAALLFNLRGDRGLGSTLMVGALTQAAAGALLLLFAFEGVICLAMAAPLALGVGLIGAAFGRALAGLEHRAARGALGGPALLLPLLTAVEPAPGAALEHVVETSVEVAAPPERVWEVVLAFPDIPRGPAEGLPDLLFDAGVATPLRARIDGAGVGAVRHCEFTTGAFVEPITVWDPPHHLAFDVVEQPAPMAELSPWELVHAPHILDGTLRSRRGEFRLEPTAAGGTRLTGRTWYTVDMAPNPYWALWVDAVVHRVHLRVLEHIGQVAGAGAP